MYLSTIIVIIAISFVSGYRLLFSWSICMYVCAICIIIFTFLLLSLWLCVVGCSHMTLRGYNFSLDLASLRIRSGIWCQFLCYGYLPQVNHPNGVRLTWTDSRALWERSRLFRRTKFFSEIPKWPIFPVSYDPGSDSDLISAVVLKYKVMSCQKKK